MPLTFKDLYKEILKNKKFERSEQERSDQKITTKNKDLIILSDLFKCSAKACACSLRSHFLILDHL